jgi:UDPglucose 6-dehydrogenase
VCSSDLLEKRIGIIGIGMVGTAVYHTFSPYFKINLYDKFKPGFQSLDDVVNNSDVLFISVPTPVCMSDQTQDLSCIYDSIESINEVSKTKKILILRSTVIPGTTRSLSIKYPNHSFVFCPEFLTERTAILDSINAYRIILGSNKKNTLDIVEKEIFRKRYPHTLIFKTNFEEAELVKYIGNCFFSVKISFMNEIYEVCRKMNINFEEVRKMFLADQRICNSHTDVPGPDGQFGFGGKCFPKDLKVFITFGEHLGLDMSVFKAANNVNERVRKKKDWLEITGATSENNYKN